MRDQGRKGGLRGTSRCDMADTKLGRRRQRGYGRDILWSEHRDRDELFPLVRRLAVRQHGRRCSTGSIVLARIVWKRVVAVASVYGLTPCQCRTNPMDSLPTVPYHWHEYTGLGIVISETASPSILQSRLAARPPAVNHPCAGIPLLCPSPGDVQSTVTPTSTSILNTHFLGSPLPVPYRSLHLGPVPSKSARTSNA
jgi:hypothetical protein